MGLRTTIKKVARNEGLIAFSLDVALCFGIIELLSPGTLF